MVKDMSAPPAVPECSCNGTYMKATREHKTEAKEKPYLSIKQYNICECVAYIQRVYVRA